MSDTQISAYISEETKRQVERYADAHGVKKGALIEQALLHHLQALRELPADVTIPPQIKLTDESFRDVVRLIGRPRRPNKALRNLMARKKVDFTP